MNLIYSVNYVVLICSLVIVKCSGQYEIPNPIIESFSPKGVRISIPDAPGVQFFAIHMNINEPISPLSPGEYSGEARKPVKGRWTYENPNIILQSGDVIHYWMFVQHDRLGYRRDDEKYSVTQLVSRYGDVQTPVTENLSECLSTLTSINGGRSSCKGQLILNEHFLGQELDKSKWKHDCHIPSDEEDNEFVSYQARPENIFLGNGRLSIWPTLLKDSEFIQTGELNLTTLCGCATNEYGFCYRQGMSYNILQPVVSASIRSRVSFRYGRVEVRAKLPGGNWLFPILTLESANNEYGRGYRSGKMRIAFVRGNKMLVSESGHDFGAHELSGGLLLGQFNPPRNHSTRTHIGQSPWTNQFHNYELTWMPDKIELGVDGVNYGTITPPADGFQSLGDLPQLGYAKEWKDTFMAPFDKEMVLRIGLACGGVTDFPDDTSSSSNIGPSRPKPWKNLDPKGLLGFWQDTAAWESTWTREESSLQVEHVKIWAL